MLKKLLIPVFAFTVAAVGCSSSSNNTADGSAGKTGTAGSTAGSTGTAGSGGSTAGTTGTAGSGGSTAGTTGTAGSGGATAGTTGTAGSGGATAGSGGATAGTTGTAGSDGGVAGHDGGAAGSDGGAAGSDGGTAIPACTSTTDGLAKIAANVFCMNFLHTCSGLDGFTIPEAYSTEEKCEAAWTANTTAVGCRQYHLCGNAVGMGTVAAAKTHCPHALGLMNVCTQ